MVKRKSKKKDECVLCFRALVRKIIRHQASPSVAAATLSVLKDYLDAGQLTLEETDLDPEKFQTLLREYHV